MILDLISHTNEILKTVTTPFDFKNPQQDPIKLAIDLTETMISNKGLGLAAPQVGIGLRALVINAETVLAIFNPKILDFAKEEVYIEEGCLSYPNLFIKIKRPIGVRVRYTMPNGDTETTKFEGLTARIFLHEYDHLEGISHLSRATAYHRELGYKNKKLLDRADKRKAKEDGV